MKVKRKKDTMAIGVFGEVPSAVLKQVLETDFSKIRKIHDWKRYVSDDVRERWPKLSLEARLAVYYIIEPIASKKE